MEKTLIYQIGRLDTNVFQKQKFHIDDTEVEAPLTSFAIQKAIQFLGKEADVFLFYPISLPFNKSLLANEMFAKSAPTALVQRIGEILQGPDHYLQRPEEFFSSHPHTRLATGHRIIHSIGSFQSDSLENPTISFDQCYYSDIVFEMLLKVIEDFLGKIGIDRVIFDISSGHNIYVSALMEAARYFNLWLNMRYLANPKDIPAIEIAFSDPIIGSRELYRIHFEPMAIKAFFDAPIGTHDVRDYNLSRSIFPLKEQRAEKRLLQDLLERFLVIFSSVKNNTPMYVYHAGYHDVGKIDELSGRLFNYISKMLFKKYDESPGLDKKNYLKAILSLSLYSGLSRLFSSKGITKYDPDKGVNLKVLENGFVSIYKSLGLNLNDAILRHEVDLLRRDSRKISGQWMMVLSLIKEFSEEPGSPVKRNFFAHAGFESHVTECKIEEGELFLRYKAESIDTIKGWLISSV